MRYFVLLLVISLASCSSPEKQLSGKELLEKSIQYHDPKGQWSTAEFTLRIQEPRIQNPERFSLVYMNNKNGAFKLMRNRGEKIASYGVNTEGNVTVLLDNKSIEDSLAIKKYMLQPERVNIYKNSYHTMLGLPMSLNKTLVSKINTVSEANFNGVPAYKLDIELKRKVFSNHWTLYFSDKDFSLLGIDIVSLNDPENGERLYFEKSIQIGDMTMPRMKHWYDLNETYLGSDIIVYEIK
ncbi:DUF6503 family protein [Pseudotenacibaculum haliotis]|uniref:DUF6503 family protein n=1 Tax=Pseudotenacibaculum haliotis TaxID=1862138 RepID=A0ABW5LP64_9FLAO